MHIAFENYRINLVAKHNKIPPASLFPWFKTLLVNVEFLVTIEPLEEVAAVVEHTQKLRFPNMTNLFACLYHPLPQEFNPSQEKHWQFATSATVFVQNISQIAPNISYVMVETYYTDNG